MSFTLNAKPLGGTVAVWLMAPASDVPVVARALPVLVEWESGVGYR